MSRYDFLVETYRTERLKTLGVWLQIPAARLDWRPEARARSPLEHMVHQCMSEDTWMRTMLGITSDRRALPSVENRHAFRALRGMFCRSPRSAREAERRVVRRANAVLRCAPHPRMGAHTPHHTHRAPSRPIAAVHPSMGIAALFDVRADGRYRRTAKAWRPRRLSQRVR